MAATGPTQPTELQVYFVDGDFITVTVTPQITAVQLRDLVAVTLGMRPAGDLPEGFKGPECFGIWVCGDDVELELHFEHLPFEYIDGWSNLMKRYSNVLDQTWYREKKKKRKEGKLKEPPCRVFFRVTGLLSLMYERKFPTPGNKFHNPLVDLFWRQAHQWLLNAYYPECDTETSVEMAGLYLQIKFGDFDPAVHKASFCPLNKLLAPRVLKKKKDKEWWSLILPKHQALAGREPLICKLLYIQRVRQFKTHCATFYEGVYQYDRSALFQHPYEEGVVVSVNANGIGLVDLSKMKHLTFYNWSQLREWTVLEATLTLKVLDQDPTATGPDQVHTETTHVITTYQAELIVESIDAAVDDIEAEEERVRNEAARQAEIRAAQAAAQS